MIKKNIWDYTSFNNKKNYKTLKEIGQKIEDVKEIAQNLIDLFDGDFDNLEDLINMLEEEMYDDNLNLRI